MILAKREKYLVSAAVLCIAIFLLIQFAVLPFFESRRKLRRGVASKEEGLTEITRLSSEYHSYQNDSRGIQQLLGKRNKDFTLFSFLDKTAGDAGVKPYINYMKPSVSEGSGPYKESLVEMKLEAITLDQLTGYLYRIESPDNVVSVKRISIKENNRKSGYLDAVLQVLTFQ